LISKDRDAKLSSCKALNPLQLPLQEHIKKFDIYKGLEKAGLSRRSGL
jgi:hypothetical protein